jgi:hypothetical protein
MHRVLRFVLLFTLLAPSWAWAAQIFDPTGKPLGSENVFLTLNDGVQHGCWTNIGEVKTYAKDKLELKGYNVKEYVEGRSPASPSLDYYFVIRAMGWRPTEAWCVGSFDIVLYTPILIRGIRHAAQIGQFSDTTIYPENMNTEILDAVGTFVSKLPRNN